MAVTQGAWSVSSVNGFKVIQCDVALTGSDSETDTYTLKTPKDLNPEKQWLLFLTFNDTPDGQALPVDLWYGYSDSFALSGQGANVVAADGAQHKQILDDCVSAVSGIEMVWIMDPHTTVADDVTYNAGVSANVKTPIAPYYAFALDGGSALTTARTATWTIIQKA